MDFTKNQKTGVRTAPPEIKQNTGAGPVATANGRAALRGVRDAIAGSRLERLGFWVLVVAAFLVVLVLLGVVLAPVIGAIVAAFFIASFVGALTLMNLQQPSAWANSLLGRQLFPVIRAPQAEVLRLAGVNAALTFAFAFLFWLVADVLNSVLLAGIILFGLLFAAGLFYSRVRRVVIRP